MRRLLQCNISILSSLKLLLLVLILTLYTYVLLTFSTYTQYIETNHTKEKTLANRTLVKRLSKPSTEWLLDTPMFFLENIDTSFLTAFGFYEAIQKIATEDGVIDDVTKSIDDFAYHLHKKLYVALARHAQYDIQPKGICLKNDSTSLIIFVHTSSQHINHRANIRETWGNKGVLKKFRYTLVFVTGYQEKVNADLLRAEARKHNDILLVDFVDSYKNLTFKALAWQKWVTLNCNHIRYILKVDDDVIINMALLNEYLEENLISKQPTEGIWCNLWKGFGPHRNKSSK